MPATGAFSGTPASIIARLEPQTVAIDDVDVKAGDTGAQVTAKVMGAINAKVGEHGIYAESTGTTGSFYTVGESVNASGAAAAISIVYGTSGTAGITSGTGVNGGVPGAGEVKGLSDLDVTTKTKLDGVLKQFIHQIDDGMTPFRIVQVTLCTMRCQNLSEKLTGKTSLFP